MTIDGVTIVGTLGSDFELRFTQGNKAVAEASVAINERRRNAQTGEWEDGDTTWVRVTCWELMAENAAQSLPKGTRVIAHGRMKNREYEKDGQKRTSLEMTADAIGPDLRWATAVVEKVRRNGGGGGSSSAQPVNTEAYQPDEEPF